MRHLTILTFAVLIFSVSCKRTVTCQDKDISIYAKGFDTNALAQARIERYQPPGFDKHLGTDSPAIAQLGLLTYYARPQYNYIIRIAGRTFRIEDIFYEDEEERQPAGFGEVDECYNTVHYTLEGLAIEGKPLRAYTPHIVIE